MKAILISIRPEWVSKILNGEKTVEIRKSIPKCELPIDVYIYCTKEQGLARLYNGSRNDTFICEKDITNNDFKRMYSGYDGKGKVVAKFTLNKADKVHLRFEKYCAGELSQDGLLKYACLTEQELDNYLWSNCCIGYAWHIDNLIPFDKPKEIKEFHKLSWAEVRYKTIREEEAKQYLLTRAPQSWCFIEV